MRFLAVQGIVILCFFCSNGFSDLKAFPSAEGYGRFAKGGRGGRVIEVTNLNDDGPGSLRAAIDATGPRTIVFTVSGVIDLKSKLLVTGTKGNGNFTLAGHTAPGKGICIHGWTFGMIGGEDVVIRHIRTRIGTSSGNTMDGMGMASANNSIFDHCSISWTIDEAFSSRSGQNITLQRTLISEALNEAGHKKYPAGTQHGYAASISGDIGSFHHNLLAHCAGRNWSLAGGLSKSPMEFAGRLDIRNNVVYNWRNRTTDGGAHQVNFVNNYYKPGPAISITVALNAQIENFPGTQSYYFDGNVMPGYFDESNQNKGRKISYVNRDRSSVNWSVFVDQPFFESHVTTQSAGDAYKDVLADVGCTRPTIDDHDKRIIDEVKNGTFTYRGSKTGFPGLIDNEKDCGGLEDYPVVKRPDNWDSDHDGMPDEWEKSHGCNPDEADDRNNTDLSSDGYTNLEMYLNELAGDQVRWNTTTVRSIKARTVNSIVTIEGKRYRVNGPVGSHVRIELLDLSGRIRDVLYRGKLQGTNKFPHYDFSGSGSAGLFLLRITTDGKETITPVIKTSSCMGCFVVQ